MNRTQKKVHQKIELTFNFTEEIPLNFDEKKLWNQASKIPSKTVKLGTIFEKPVSSRVILKIVGATPPPVKIFKPTRKLSGNFIYKYIYRYK